MWSAETDWLEMVFRKFAITPNCFQWKKGADCSSSSAFLHTHCRFIWPKSWWKNSLSSSSEKTDFLSRFMLYPLCLASDWLIRFSTFTNIFLKGDKSINYWPHGGWSSFVIPSLPNVSQAIVVEMVKVNRYLRTVTHQKVCIVCLFIVKYRD